MRRTTTNTGFSKSKWVNGKIELWLFVSLCIIGIVSSIFLLPPLDHYPYNSGKNLLGMYVPPFLSVCYLIGISVQYRPDRKVLVKTFLLFAILIAPYASLMLQVFQPTFGDDFHRYYVYARYMIDHHTLYGADSLSFPGMGRYYLTQPGYRYFIAAELVLFGHLYRFVQFINLAILVFGIFLFVQVIKHKGGQYTMLLLAIVLLFTPYAIKNSIMGLSEWFTAFLLMLATWIYVMKRSAAATIFLLALVPFFRQNLLIAILLLAFVIILSNRNRALLLACFVIPLLLPLYHNLYFAGEWRFLVKLHAVPLLNPDYPASLNPAVFGENLFRLIGLEITRGKIRFDWLAFAFLPLSIFVIVELTRKLSARWRFYYIILSLSALLPGLLLGKDYYPRFEFMSIVVIFVAYNFLPLETRKKD
jgi:hypothetical protein